MGNILTGIRVAARLKSANWQHANNEELFQCLDWSIDEAYGHITPDEILEQAARLSGKTKAKSKSKAEPKEKAKKTSIISQRDEKSDSEKMMTVEDPSNLVSREEISQLRTDFSVGDATNSEATKQLREVVVRQDANIKLLSARTVRHSEKIIALQKKLAELEGKMTKLVESKEPPLENTESEAGLEPNESGSTEPQLATQVALPSQPSSEKVTLSPILSLPSPQQSPEPKETPSPQKAKAARKEPEPEPDSEPDSESEPEPRATRSYTSSQNTAEPKEPKEPSRETQIPVKEPSTPKRKRSKSSEPENQPLNKKQRQDTSPQDSRSSSAEPVQSPPRRRLITLKSKPNGCICWMYRFVSGKYAGNYISTDIPRDGTTRTKASNYIAAEFPNSKTEAYLAIYNDAKTNSVLDKKTLHKTLMDQLK